MERLLENTSSCDHVAEGDGIGDNAAAAAAADTDGGGSGGGDRGDEYDADDDAVV